MALNVIDINCDLGEGFGHWTLGETKDADLMPLISSANIATGFHAGDPNLMNATVADAVSRGVGIGAHPGYRDLVGFGRRRIDAGTEELINDIVYQVGALDAFAKRHGKGLQHVKLHGALYMTAAKDAGLSALLVQALKRIDAGLYLYCMGISETHAAAVAAGLPVVREFYADRDYDQSGSIVFRRKMEKPDPERLAAKVVRACLEGKVETVEGGDIEIGFDSVCFHSDTPGALEIGRALRAALERNGIRVAPITEILPLPN